jgi:hypothetical protein
MQSLVHWPFLNGSNSTAVANGEFTYVFPFGVVQTTIDYTNLTLTNTTMSDHTLCCGSVTMQVVPGMVNNGGIYVPGLQVQITGTGTNSNWPLSVANSFFSPQYWGAVGAMQQHYYQNILGGQPLRPDYSGVPGWST